MMELLEGETLEARRERTGEKFRLAEVLHSAQQILGVLLRGAPKRNRPPRHQAREPVSYDASKLKVFVLHIARDYSAIRCDATFAVAARPIHPSSVAASVHARTLARTAAGTFTPRAARTARTARTASALPSARPCAK